MNENNARHILISILIGVVWTPSAYFFNSWSRDRDDSDRYVIITTSIFALVTLAAIPFIVSFAIIVLASPFLAIVGLYRLLPGLYALLRRLPSFCTALGLWCLSWRWALRSARYDSQSRRCRLCERCSNIVEKSRILRGTPWRLTRPREEYDFYSKSQLQQSAQTCHLCSLLWHGSFDPQAIPAPASCSEESTTSEPDITTPLLARGGGLRESASKLSVEISATRPFGQELSMYIQLCDQESGSFQSLTIQDSWHGTF